MQAPGTSRLRARVAVVPVTGARVLAAWMGPAAGFVKLASKRA